MSQSQQTTTTSTDRESATDTEWVAVSKCRGTKTPLHRLAPEIDPESVDHNDEVETLCDEGFDDSVTHKAKKSVCYPPGYRRLCPKCFPVEADDGE
jgi:hypothetical protein